MIHITMESFAEFLDVLQDEVILQQEVSKATNLMQVLKIARSNRYYGLTLYEATNTVRDLVKEDKKRKKASSQRRDDSLTYREVTVTINPRPPLPKGLDGLQYLPSEIIEQII